ncbi:MAG: rRNA pseudouridine synthase [Planctomycetes bacterium]|nr:rRNA pseudouridine synthase [Planctomycetota bacterium]
MVSSSPIFLFHKPRNIVTTKSDELGRKTVYDVLPAWVRDDGWIPVGRLDRDTRGLLLFVQGGRLMDALSRPGTHDKTYEVWVRGRVHDTAPLLKGVKTALGLLRAKEVRVLGGAAQKTRLEVVLDEGKNRHIRRLFGALRDPQRGTPLKVVELKRVQFGPVKLDVPSGAWRFLTEDECAALA